MIFHPQLSTLCQTIDFHARSAPDATAVITLEGEGCTYGELDAASSRVAAGLRALGHRPGTRVAYLGRESQSYWEVLLGAAKSGTVLVPINWRLSPPEIEHIVSDCDAAAIFLDGDHPMRARTGRPEIELGQPFRSWTAEQPAQPPDEVAITPETPLVQLYTSGTTGLPKGVVLAHRSFFAIRDALGEAGLDWIDWQPGDVALVGIPGFHIGGLWFAAQAMHAGATVVSTAEFDVGHVSAGVRRLGITTAIVVPSMLRSLVADPRTDAQDFASLRKIVYGGSPISENLLERCITTFGCDFAQIYGLTETGNTAICLPPADHVPGSPRLRAAGLPYPTVEVRVRDRSGSDVASGCVGEVVLSTPAAMVEYWRLPDATAQTVVDGWIVTGDAGYLDDDGYLYIHDRVKDMIVVGGENVYPAEVENALVAHPAVADAAVIGAPDDYSGEMVVAYLVTEPGCTVTTRELRTFLTGHLAPFKLPSRVFLQDRIPRNPSGKILRRELRDLHWLGRDRQVN